MGYILKNTSALVNTRLTDTGRKKLSEGNFNISYFQIGDSEVSYNTLPSSYGQLTTNILEPNFNCEKLFVAPIVKKNNFYKNKNYIKKEVIIECESDNDDFTDKKNCDFIDT